MRKNFPVTVRRRVHRDVGGGGRVVVQLLRRRHQRRRGASGVNIFILKIFSLKNVETVGVVRKINVVRLF
jgi:hypothetical protein